MRTRLVACAALVGKRRARGRGVGRVGPAPPPVMGEPGIPVAGGAHVVTIAGPNASSTRVWLVRDRGGKMIRKRVLTGKLGVPAVTFNGVAEGTWAKGRRLVLSSSVYDDQRARRFTVIDTRTLRAVKTIVLRGAFAFDALSPDGRRLYLLQFPQGSNSGIRYVVRSLNMRTGQLEPGAIVDRDRARRRDERDRDVPGLGPGPDVGLHALQRWRLPRVHPRARTRGRAPRAASTCPGRARRRTILEQSQLTVEPRALTLDGPGRPAARDRSTRETFAVTGVGGQR